MICTLRVVAGRGSYTGAFFGEIISVTREKFFFVRAGSYGTMLIFCSLGGKSTGDVSCFGIMLGLTKRWLLLSRSLLRLLLKDCFTAESLIGVTLTFFLHTTRKLTRSKRNSFLYF